MTEKGLMSFEYVAEARPLRGAWLQLILFLLLTAFLAVSIMVFTSFPALAAGPHGPYGSTTEKCEKCHAMHTGATQTLLGKKSVIELCESCHSGGIGADTAVMQGALMKPASPDSDEYVVAGTLLGGGFDGVGGATDTTSKHNLGEVAAPYGNTDMGATIELTCTSCHTPHEGPNYRLLRRRVGDAAADLSVTWNGPEQLGDGTTDYYYDEEDMDPGTPGVQYCTYNYRSGMSAWCSTCHAKYMTRSDALPYNAGDNAGDKVRYRHAVDVPVMGRFNIYNPATAYDLPTDLPLQDVGGDGRTNEDTITCLTCHMAHGSNATMGAGINAQASTRGSLPVDSMLLRLNDRQICQIACHKVVN